MTCQMVERFGRLRGYFLTRQLMCDSGIQDLKEHFSPITPDTVTHIFQRNGPPECFLFSSASDFFLLLFL